MTVRPPAEIGMPLDEVDTPALIVDLGAFERNLHRLRDRVAGTGVRVISVDPGEMNTRMHADAMPEADPDSLISPDVIAEKIVMMIQQSTKIDGKTDGITNGSRLIASDWRPYESGARASRACRAPPPPPILSPARPSPSFCATRAEGATPRSS